MTMQFHAYNQTVQYITGQCNKCYYISITYMYSHRITLYYLYYTFKEGTLQYKVTSITYITMYKFIK